MFSAASYGDKANHNNTRLLVKKFITIQSLIRNLALRNSFSWKESKLWFIAW